MAFNKYRPSAALPVVESAGVTRRQVVHGALWATPVVMLATSVPALAASDVVEPPTFEDARWMSNSFQVQTNNMNPGDRPNASVTAPYYSNLSYNTIYNQDENTWQSSVPRLIFGAVWVEFEVEDVWIDSSGQVPVWFSSPQTDWDIASVVVRGSSAIIRVERIKGTSWPAHQNSAQFQINNIRYARASNAPAEFRARTFSANAEDGLIHIGPYKIYP